MAAVAHELRARLFASAHRVHTRHLERCDGEFTSFVPTDYELAYETLVSLDHDGGSFVELGSGAGVVTILADLLGYDAYGIELDPWLVEAAAELADSVGSAAEFVTGSFVPPAMRESVELQPADTLLETEGIDAWAELGMRLGDFDVVYDYHWPDQAAFHGELLTRGVRRGATVLRYSHDDGFDATTWPPAPV